MNLSEISTHIIHFFRDSWFQRFLNDSSFPISKSFQFPTFTGPFLEVDVERLDNNKTTRLTGPHWLSEQSVWARRPFFPFFPLDFFPCTWRGTLPYLKGCCLPNKMAKNPSVQMEVSFITDLPQDLPRWESQMGQAQDTIQFPHAFCGLLWHLHTLISHQCTFSAKKKNDLSAVFVFFWVRSS